MTEAWSGFFRPEEKAARGRDATSSVGPFGSEVAQAILRLLSAQGPKDTSDLIAQIKAPPRATMAAIDEIEEAGLVRTWMRGASEYVELTEEGRVAANP